LKPPSILPKGRAIVNRRTGQIVGPIAAIAADGWPYQSIADSEILWRYMELPKFENLLNTATLYFARPDRFSDSVRGARIALYRGVPITANFPMPLVIFRFSQS
jgi:hypothetical protein